MTAAESLARIASLIGHPSRARMLLALLDGRSHAASELAEVAGVSAATASEHLAALTGAGLVRRAAAGRTRLYAIASPEVARAIETLLAIAPETHRILARPMKPIRVARTCYDHLAGRVGVALTDALVALGAILPVEPGEQFAVTDTGSRLLAEFGIDLARVRTRKRLFAGQCIDWTERRPHVSGALGAAIAARAIELGWFERLPGTRTLDVTGKGWAAMAREFGLHRETILGSAAAEASSSAAR